MSKDQTKGQSMYCNSQDIMLTGQCLPMDRIWPEKCTRCDEKGLPCSEPIRAPGKRQRRDEVANESTTMVSSPSAVCDEEIFQL